MASWEPNAVLRLSEVGLPGLSVAAHGARPAGISHGAHQSLLLKPCQPRGSQGRWCIANVQSHGWEELSPCWGCPLQGYLRSHLLWDHVEAQWKLWVGCPMGCCNPGNCSSADVEESLVHQSFCFALLVMGYFESLWIFEIVSVSWLFMNNKHKKKNNPKTNKAGCAKRGVVPSSWYLQ